jgi:hypothetical protein
LEKNRIDSRTHVLCAALATITRLDILILPPIPPLDKLTRPELPHALLRRRQIHIRPNPLVGLDAVLCDHPRELLVGWEEVLVRTPRRGRKGGRRRGVNPLNVGGVVAWFGARLLVIEVLRSWLGVGVGLVLVLVLVLILVVLLVDLWPTVQLRERLFPIAFLPVHLVVFIFITAHLESLPITEEKQLVLPLILVCGRRRRRSFLGFRAKARRPGSPGGRGTISCGRGRWY